MFHCSENPVSAVSPRHFCDLKASIGIIFQSSHHVRHLSHGANEGRTRAALRKASFVEIVEFEGAKKVHPQINELRRREARKELADSQTGIEMEEDPNRLPAAAPLRTKTTVLSNGIAAPHQGLRRRRTRRPRARQQKTDIAPHAVSAMEALQSA